MPKHSSRFSEKIKRLEANKTNLLFCARERIAAEQPIEAARAFAQAAQLEEEIATVLKGDGFLKDALISWVSAASCYHLAGDFSEALRVSELVLSNPDGERYRDVIERIKIDCEEKIAALIAMQYVSPLPEEQRPSHGKSFP